MTSAQVAFAPEELVAVHLWGLPVPLAARSRDHSERQLREFAFLAADELEDPEPGEIGVVRRLLDACIAMVHGFHGLNDRAEQTLTEAIDEGRETIDDLLLQLPQEAGPAMTALAAALDDADYHCWDGEDLFALATPLECVAYRRWVVSQVLDQLDGRPPIRWTDSTAARAWMLGGA